MKSYRFLIIVMLVVAICTLPAITVSASGVVTTGAAGQQSEKAAVEDLKSSAAGGLSGWLPKLPQTGVVNSTSTTFNPGGAAPANENNTGGSPAPAASAAASITPTVPASKTVAGKGEDAGETLTEAEIIASKIQAVVAETEENSEQFLVQVTKPETNETVFKSTYSICGVRNAKLESKEAIVVYLLRYNPETLAYNLFEDVDGAYAWEISANGVFTKNVALSTGDNKFALAAYKASLGSAFTATDVQVTMFNITYKGQVTVDKINEKLKELTVSSIFKEIENKESASIK